MKSMLFFFNDPATPQISALSLHDALAIFNPVVDRLRIVSDMGQNLRVNVDTGAMLTEGSRNLGSTTPTAPTGAAYTSNYAATCRIPLYFIAPPTDKLLTTTHPTASTVTQV